MHFAYTQSTPSLSLNNPREYHRKYQSSVPLSPVLPSSLSLSLSLNPGLRFRFSDVSFLRFRMEGNTRAAVIGESTPFSNPRIRHESVVFVSLFPPRLLFHVSLLLLSRPRASVPSQVSLFHDFLVSDFSLSPRFLSSLYSLDLSRSYRCGLYLCTLSLFLSIPCLPLLAIQWKRWLSHCSTSRIKRISDDSRFHLGSNAPMGG